MKSHPFWSVVPRGVRIGAFTVAGCAVLIGLVAGTAGDRASAHGASWPFLESAAGLGLGALAGAFFAVWILCLGYVFGDARRRAMPAILWTLIALLVPNLLGFLFYFALRRPTASPCSHCGQLIGADQRFCAWCGAASTPLSGAVTPPGPSGTIPTAPA